MRKISFTTKLTIGYILLWRASGGGGGSGSGNGGDVSDGDEAYKHSIYVEK